MTPQTAKKKTGTTKRIVSIVLFALSAVLIITSIAGFVIRGMDSPAGRLNEMRTSAVVHVASGGLVDGIAAEANAAKLKELDIRCTSAAQPTGQLSGGNQQKVCIARALALKPKFLFVSEPTRGIDIGAKQLVLETLVRLNREQKLTIVIVSSELQELRSICDRIAIVSEGRINCILRPDSSDASFGLAMSGAKVNGGDLA